MRPRQQSRHPRGTAQAPRRRRLRLSSEGPVGTGHLLLGVSSSGGRLATSAQMTSEIPMLKKRSPVRRFPSVAPATPDGNTYAHANRAPPKMRSASPKNKVTWARGE